MYINTIRYLGKVKYFILFSGLLISVMELSAQTSEPSWVSIARGYYAEEMYQKADSLIDRNRSEIGFYSFYNLWFFAQVKNKVNKPNQANSFYTKAIALNYPDDAIFMDYSDFLIKWGRIYDAREVIRNYLKERPESLNGIALHARLNMWDGRMRRARRDLDTLVEKNYSAEELRSLNEYYQLLRKPKGELHSGIYTDDQSIISFFANFEGKMFINRFFDFGAKLKLRTFNFEAIEGGRSNLTTAEIGLSNSFKISSTNTRFRFGGGALLTSVNSELLWFGELSQQISRYAKFDFSYSKLPYLFTIASLEQPLTNDEIKLAINYSQGEKRYFETSFFQWIFPDFERINTFYAYYMQSIWIPKIYNFMLGYSFSYMNTTTNTFRPLEEIGPGTAFGQPLPGVYSPYFSPMDMYFNSVLFLASANLPKNVFQLKASYGFYASANNPSVFATVDLAGNYNYVLDFSDVIFIPFEISATIGFGEKNKETFFLQYDFKRLFFFTSHLLGIKLTF